MDNAGATGPQQSITSTQSAPEQTASNLTTARAAGDPPPAAPSVQAQTERKPEVNIDSATGQPNVVYEGTTVDAVLMNRLDGDVPDPVKVLVSNAVYSHDRQHVLIPEGTIVLGGALSIQRLLRTHRVRTPAGAGEGLCASRGYHLRKRSDRPPRAKL